jgi:hypothetical protein
VQILVLLSDPYDFGGSSMPEKIFLMQQESQHSALEALIEYIRYLGYEMPVTLLYQHLGDNILSDADIAGAKVLPEVQILRSSIHDTQQVAAALSQLWNK